MNGVILAALVIVACVVFALRLTAADCPAGHVAVNSAWNWPVCVRGAVAP